MSWFWAFLFAECLFIWGFYFAYLLAPSLSDWMLPAKSSILLFHLLTLGCIHLTRRYGQMTYVLLNFSHLLSMGLFFLDCSLVIIQGLQQYGSTTSAGIVRLLLLGALSAFSFLRLILIMFVCFAFFLIGSIVRDWPIVGAHVPSCSRLVTTIRVSSMTSGMPFVLVFFFRWYPIRTFLNKLTPSNSM